MQEPIEVWSSIPAGKRRYTKPIPLVRTRTLWVFGACTFHGSATKGATIEVYFSPDGSEWANPASATIDIALSAGNRRTKDAYVVCPEHGYVRFAMLNNDSAQALTDAKLWYSIQSYPGEPQQSKGSVLKDEGEEG